MARLRSRPLAPEGSPLLDALLRTLARSGCDLLRVEGTDRDGFRLSFEDRLLRRSGISGLLLPLQPAGTGPGSFFTTIRHPDSFESGPGLRDAFGLYLNVLLAVDPTGGLFVAFDPTRHSPEDRPLRVSISAREARVAREQGWHSWLREGWERRAFDFAEALVGFRAGHLLAYLEFERIAIGLETGHRRLLADTFLDVARERSGRA